MNRETKGPLLWFCFTAPACIVCWVSATIFWRLFYNGVEKTSNSSNWKYRNPLYSICFDIFFSAAIVLSFSNLQKISELLEPSKTTPVSNDENIQVESSNTVNIQSNVGSIQLKSINVENVQP
ncbi:hypothetical protein V6N11_073150 [Hibiscus sabdariffa]|uniref:Transmembrane protein n=1 Tax=Hibiscus sabdariffa TaxID=183260 RepID=A0ABR1ZJH6_9ROSI